jgi:hypothetical protein
MAAAAAFDIGALALALAATAERRRQATRTG